MTDNEREMLRERESSMFGERQSYESARQATYEDSVAVDPDDESDRDERS